MSLSFLFPKRILVKVRKLKFVQYYRVPCSHVVDFSVQTSLLGKACLYSAKVHIRVKAHPIEEREAARCLKKF